MKFILLTGDVITPQLLVTNNKKTKAVDVCRYIKNKKAFPKYNWKANIVLIVGTSTEYTEIEELTFSELKTLLEAVFLKTIFTKKKQFIGKKRKKLTQEYALRLK